MRTVLYKTPAKRLSLIKAAEAKGETMIHDDFWVGPNQENRLTFGVLPITEPDTRTTQIATLTAKLKADTVTDSELRQLLRAERGL